MAERTRYRPDWRDYTEEYPPRDWPGRRRGLSAPNEGAPLRDAGYGEPGFETRGPPYGYPDDGSPSWYDEHGPRRPSDLRHRPDYGPADYNDVYGGTHRDTRRRWSEEQYRGRSRQEDRGFLDKAADEVSSWFGDEEAERRREMDHRGRGPKGYVRSDSRIHEDVCDRLADDWIVDAGDVEVTVADREVTLSGTVASREERRRAEDCAEAVAGVTHVQNNLRVRSRPERAVM